MKQAVAHCTPLKVSKTITPDLKKQMLAGDVAALREKYLEASRRSRAG